MDSMWVLAQTAEHKGTSRVSGEQLTSEGEATTVVPSDSNAPAAGREGPKPFIQPWLLLALMFVLFYFILFRGPRKKQQQHKQMVQSLQKNDKVRTIGGILGTVVDIRGDEITLKVDEKNNTKITVASSAIGKRLSKDEN